MADCAGVVGVVAVGRDAVGSWCVGGMVRSVVGAAFIVWSGHGAFGRGRGR